jgi:hypothetical protein
MLWHQTSRHMGVCGPSFWFKDQTDLYGIPKAYLYVAPWRLFPVPNDDGNLAFWLLDADQKGKKPQRIEIDDLLQFDLELPDEGFFGIGLMVSAINKIQFGTALDRHATAVVASGGRLSGIISPKAGVIDNDNIYQQLVRDWRNIAEQPEAAKRAQVVRYPIEFTKTVADMQQLEVVKLLTNNRDELLELWGVPLSQIGGSTAAGLNSGDVRKYDRQALIQNAVEPRCDVMTEVIQADLKCWERYLGWVPKFTFDVPSFEDDSPRYDKVQKSLGVPMKGSERRELLGLDPLGPDIKDAQGRIIDDLILVNNTLVDITEMGSTPQKPVAAPPPASPGTAIAGAAPLPPVAPAPLKAKLSQPDYAKVVLTDLSHQYPPAALTWVKLVTWSFDDGVKLDKIDGADRPGAPRVKKVVDAVKMGIEAGADIDPLVLVDMPSQKLLAIANGYHRWEAADQSGMKRVQAYIGSASLANEKTVLAAITTMQAPQFEDKGPGTNPRTKADLRSSMLGFRKSVEAEYIPRISAAASRVLDEQKRSIVAEVRMKHAHLMSHPGDVDAWWKPERWNTALLDALTGTYRAIGSAVPKQINAHKADLGVAFGPAVPIDPKITQAIITNAAKRITEINDFTRDGIRSLIEQGATDGLSPAALGDLIEGWTGFDEYRSERIATTELRSSYNQAARESYADAGIELLEAIDGDGDEECAARNGQTYSIDDAAAEDADEHPNGTLDWLPVVTETVDDGEAGKAVSIRSDKVADFLAELDAEDQAAEQRTTRKIQALADQIEEGKAKSNDMRDLAAAVMALASREAVAPIIHVAAPQVTVAPSPAPIVKMPGRKPVTRRVTRDNLGRIESVTEE